MNQGIQFLQENDLLQNTPEDIAQFLYKGEGLNKTVIGDYLGERSVPFPLPFRRPREVGGGGWVFTERSLCGRESNDARVGLLWRPAGTGQNRQGVLTAWLG